MKTTSHLTPDPDAEPQPDGVRHIAAPGAAADAPDPLLALVRAAAAGEREALVRLLSSIAPPVTATVRVLLGARHPELDDAVQETLVAVTASLARFRGDSSFLHYARRIAVRTALALRRAHDRGQRGLALARAAEPRPDPWRSEASPLEREQRVAIFVKLLDELPEGQAECLAYRVLLELPLPQIAQELGVPINTVRSRVRLARNHLRDRIDADPALAAALKEEP
jgi:RNA polymerase sigma factor (sigma-70 family)